MEDNKIVGSLVLRTYDIAPSTQTFSTITAGPTYVDFDNAFGSSFANGAYIVWKNVNIRTCIGELYSKYNKFNFKMTSAQIRHNNATVPTATTDAHFVVFISGLPFSSGSTYNTRLAANNQAVLGVLILTLQTQ